MARNGSGTFLTPNTFVADTPIVAADHNENWSDAATEITNSLALDGQSAMVGQLKAANGTVGAPGITFGSDLNSGVYRIGADNVGIAVAATKIVDVASTGATITGTVDATLIKQGGFQVVPLLASGTFTTASQQTIVLTAFTGYRGFRFVFTDVTSTSDTTLALQTSTNGGSSYDSGAADYAYIGQSITNNSAVVTIADDDDNTAVLMNFTSNGANDVCTLEVTLYSPSTAKMKLVKWEATSIIDAISMAYAAGGGSRFSAADVDAVRFFPLAGTFSGAYAVFGIP